MASASPLRRGRCGAIGTTEGPQRMVQFKEYFRMDFGSFRSRVSQLTVAYGPEWQLACFHIPDTLAYVASASQCNVLRSRQSVET